MLSSAHRYLLTLLFAIYLPIVYSEEIRSPYLLADHKPLIYSSFGLPQNAGSFSLTSDANIRSIEFYFYSNATCSSGLLAGANILVNNFLTTSTNILANQTYYFDSTAIFNIAKNVLGSAAAVTNVQCIQAYLEGNNANSSTSQCMSFNNETCSSSGTSCTTSTSTQTSSWAPASSSNWGLPTVCQTRNVYIGQNTSPVTGAALYACVFDASTGTSFTSCTASSHAPTSVAYSIGNVFFGGYFYFLTTGTGNNNVYKCNYDPTQSAANAISNCTTQSISGGFQGPRSIAFSHNTAFITDSNGSTGRLISCTVNTDGSLTGCNPVTTGLTLQVPIGIAINNDYLYISDFRANSISYCSMSGATISSCTNISTSGIFRSPKQIAIYNNYAYIINSANGGTNGAVTSCNISNGSFSSSDCTSALSYSGFSAPQSIFIYNGYAYITDLSGTIPVTVCTNVSNGTISDCSSIGTTSVSKPTSISIF